ncbi:MAG: cupin domain-containing protein [Polyangiaceae bacterium]|jgi:quercetin dioxygenase-like cupin family protein|nr:cupin domain-containing protein [Polyangiaceae bacterium]
MTISTTKINGANGANGATASPGANGTPAAQGANGTSSGAFTDTSKNRDSLVPLPARAPDAACVHRGVVSAEVAAKFSGERGHPVYPIRLPSTTVSLSIGDLEPAGQTSNHRHAYESLVYVMEGEGYTLVEGERFEWRAGDAFYVPPWCWHRHVAAEGGPVRYLTATNMPLLNAIGQTVMREEQRE